MIYKATKQIINVTGDLHGGWFYFLAAGNSIFYASLIQPIHNLLGWKRISGTDVTKCYQQAAGIDILIADKLEKNLYAEYFLHIITDDEKRLKFESFEDEKELSVHVARNFLQWMELKQTSTTNKRFCMSSNYVYIMNFYRTFCLSVRAGDDVMIEWLYKEFLPIFLATEKTTYLEIVLGMIDEQYGYISSKLLQLV